MTLLPRMRRIGFLLKTSTIGLSALCSRHFLHHYFLQVSAIASCVSAVPHIIPNADSMSLTQPFLSLWRPAVLWRGILYALLMSVGKLSVSIPIVLCSVWSRRGVGESSSLIARFQDSAFPALFVGVAMIARGEIGLLIAQIAREGDTSTGNGLLDNEAFLVAIWAILLCTLLGPIGVGFIVTRWKNKIVHGAWT
jgi:hypothetical protein